MWERRSYFDGASHRCTVKFSGPIPSWPKTLALGVEWDDPSRGRNDGELNGVTYFHCQVPGAGSFIKASRTPETAVSVGAAIYSKYIDQGTFEAIQLQGGKSVETVGIEELRRKHEHLEKLEVITLEASRVKDVVGGPIRLEALSALRSLDLSNNLLQSFDDVLRIVAALPRLTCLRLNGNRLVFNTVRQFPRLRELNLSNCLVSEIDIAVVSDCFPDLRTLSLAQNRLKVVPSKLPKTLTTLDLSCNLISRITGLPPSLESLFISDNDIKELRSSVSLPLTLDVRGHHLNWDSISLLGASEVLSVHLTHFDDQRESHRSFIIARCPNLKMLNGTVITSNERSDSERYTLNAVIKKKHPTLPQDVWKDLVRKYGAPAPLADRSIRARLYSFYLGENPNPLRIVKDAPVSRFLRQISRAANVPLRGVRLARIAGCRQVDSDTELGSLLTVEQIIEDGAHLELIE